MKVAIIILHYKNVKDTLSCLKSIAKLDKDGFGIRTILVDNNSKFKVQSAKLSPQMRDPAAAGQFKIQNLSIVYNKRNLGFAAGINVGIRKALEDKDTDYVLILNNDTILPGNLLQVLLEDKVDIVAPVIKFKSLEGKLVYDYGGKVNWWTGRTKHLESTNYPIIPAVASNFAKATLFKKAMAGKQLTNKLISNVVIDYVSGCCMLVRREIFEKIGLFDEDFFFYFEDADFCSRAKKAGFKVEVNSNVAVFHKLGGSIGRWTKEAIVQNLKGNFLFISKHLGWRRPVGYVYLFLLSCKIFVNYVRERVLE